MRGVHTLPQRAGPYCQGAHRRLPRSGRLRRTAVPASSCFVRMTSPWSGRSCRWRRCANTLVASVRLPPGAVLVKCQLRRPRSPRYPTGKSWCHGDHHRRRVSQRCSGTRCRRRRARSQRLDRDDCDDGGLARRVLRSHRRPWRRPRSTTSVRSSRRRSMRWRWSRMVFCGTTTGTGTSISSVYWWGRRARCRRLSTTSSSRCSTSSARSLPAVVPAAACAR